MPWRIATGLSLIIWVLAAFLIGEQLNYLEPYSSVLFLNYSTILATHLLTAVVALFALIYWLARRAGLGDVGGKLKLLDKRLIAGDAHDDQLSRAMQKERLGSLTNAVLPNLPLHRFQRLHPA